MDVLVGFLICAVIGLTVWTVRLRSIIALIGKELERYREVEALAEKVRRDLGPPLIQKEVGPALTQADIQGYVDRARKSVGLFGVKGGFRMKRETADFSKSSFGPRESGLIPYIANDTLLHRMSSCEGCVGKFLFGIYIENDRKAGPEHPYATVILMCNSIMLVEFIVHFGNRGPHLEFTITVLYSPASKTPSLLSEAEALEVLRGIRKVSLD